MKVNQIFKKSEYNEAIDGLQPYLGCISEQLTKFMTSLVETLRAGFCKKRKNLSLKSCYNDMLVLTIISLIPRMYFFFSRLLSPKGLPETNDTQYYLDHAYLFMKSFQFDIDFNGIFYISYYALLGLLLTVFRSREFVIFIQMVINALNVILVYKIAIMLFNRRRTAIAAGIIYAFLRPVIFWSIFIITDSLFISLMLLQTFFILKAQQNGKRLYWLLFWITSVYMVFFRPTGIITLTFAIMYIIINLGFKKFIKKYKIFVIVLTAVTIVLFVYFIASTSLEPLRKSLYYLLIWLLQDNYSKGYIYDISTPFNYRYKAIETTEHFGNYVLSFFINNWKNILILYVKRLVSFAGVWIWKLEHVNIYHKLKYLIPFVLSLVTGSVGIISMLKGKIFRRSSILVFETLSIVVFTVIFFMDSAYRYRAPSLVFIGIIAAYGLDMCIEYILNRFNRKKGMGV